MSGAPKSTDRLEILAAAGCLNLHDYHLLISLARFALLQPSEPYLWAHLVSEHACGLDLDSSVADPKLDGAVAKFLGVKRSRR